MSQLVTGEAVALDLRPAALPSRVIAGLLDAVLQIALLALVGGIASAVSVDVSDAAAGALGIVVLVLVLIAYPVVCETLSRGRTPGKAAMGLRVVRDDGGPVGFRHALVRGLAGAFLERPGITLFVGAVVTSLLNGHGKRIGDLLAGTVVLRERVTARGGSVAQMPPQLAGWAAGLDLARLPDGLALSARQFMARADELTDAAREDLGGRLVHAVVDAVGPPPPGTPGWAVLAAVLAERRRRETSRLGAPADRAPTSGTGAATPPAGGSVWASPPSSEQQSPPQPQPQPQPAPHPAPPHDGDRTARPSAPPPATASAPAPSGAGGFVLPD